MRLHCRLSLVAVLLVLHAASASLAQVRRYEPSRPTVSPYLQLFRDDVRNQPLPNYYAYVRPLQQQYQVNQTQQRLLQQQSRTIGQLQTNMQSLERRQIEGPLVAPTGKGSWFLTTPRYYPRSRVGPPR